MDGLEIKIVVQIITKLGCETYPALITKSTELVRLLELKSSKIVSSIGDYGKITVCIDLAASELGIIVDNDLAVKISGLRKAAYIKYKRIIEKLLNLSLPLSINEICTQLNMNEIALKAVQILDLFKNCIETKNADVDFSHPQYAAMAVYQASKLEKKKIPKTKIVQISHLKPMQWNKLEQQWDRIISSASDRDKNATKTDDQIHSVSNLLYNITANVDKPKETPIRKIDEMEGYETWKKRIITFAQLELGLMNAELKD